MNIITRSILKGNQTHNKIFDNDNVK